MRRRPSALWKGIHIAPGRALPRSPDAATAKLLDR